MHEHNYIRETVNDKYDIDNDQFVYTGGAVVGLFDVISFFYPNWPIELLMADTFIKIICHDCDNHATEAQLTELIGKYRAYPTAEAVAFFEPFLTANGIAQPE